MTYSILPSPKPISSLGCWESQLPHFTEVVGYSWLGHFFLKNAQTNEFAVLHPFRQAYKNYGNFKSVVEFELSVLADESFSEYVLKPKHQLAIKALIGELGQEEVYIPTPYPFLGGNEEPETYMKGNVWVFAELVGISHGFE